MSLYIKFFRRGVVVMGVSILLVLLVFALIQYVVLVSTATPSAIDNATAVSGQLMVDE